MSGWERWLGRGPLRALRVRQFRVLWLTLLVAQLGFWMSNVALQWHVTQVSGGDPLALGLLYFFNLLPLLVLTPFVGVLADSTSRQLIMVSAQTAMGLVAVTLGVLLVVAEPFSVAGVLVLATALGVAMASGGPASQALVADIVPRDLLASAVSVNSVSLNISRMAGPAAAAPVLVVWGAAPAVIGYGVACLGAAVAVSRMRFTHEPRPPGAPEPVVRRIRAGVAYARRRRPAALTLLLVAATAGFGSTYVSMLPVLTSESYGRPSGDFTYLITVSAAGALAGSLLAGRGARVTSLRLVAVLVACNGVVLAALALVGDFLVAAALVAVVGGLCFGVLTACNVLVQSVVEDHMRGRVMSLYLVAWAGSVPVGALLLGWLAGIISPPSAVLVFAGLCTMCGTAVAIRAGHRRDG